MSQMKDRLKAKRKETRGGARPGAGRPAKDGPTVRMYVRVPTHLAVEVQQQAEERGIDISTRLRQIIKDAVRSDP